MDEKRIIRSMINFSDQAIRHFNNEGELSIKDKHNQDFIFTVHSQAAVVDPNQPPVTTVKFESVNFPGKFLRHKNFRILLESPGDSTFDADSTFTLRNGLRGVPGDGSVSFQSVNFTDRWIRHIDFHIFIDTVLGDKQGEEDATFVLEDPAS
jgi:hypothetical protein